MAQTSNGQRRQTPTNNTNSTNNKSNKFANAGAAAGGFVGAMGGSFVPPINININRTQNVGVQGGRRGSGGNFILPEPVFNNTDEVQNYCNHVRALMIACAIELAMASKILEARLAQVPPKPDESAVQAKIRAKRVAWKLKRAADSATAVAKNSVAAYGAFTREYADFIRPRPQQAATTNPFKF